MRAAGKSYRAWSSLSGIRDRQDVIRAVCDRRVLAKDRVPNAPAGRRDGLRWRRFKGGLEIRGETLQTDDGLDGEPVIFEERAKLGGPEEVTRDERRLVDSGQIEQRRVVGLRFEQQRELGNAPFELRVDLHQPL